MRGKIPMRKCVGCGASKEKKELIRIVRTSGGEILLDRTGRMNGRGAYLCSDPQCLEKARKRHSLSRSLGAAVPDEVYGGLLQELEEGHAG